jgi:hypothetical protein
MVNRQLPWIEPYIYLESPGLALAHQVSHPYNAGKFEAGSIT